ncbi:MAG: hypothetical protein ONB23_10055 [candidate division KSB1 bacterium]|nr:hypothetical protein [candidate division KSB1 bacterium]
MASRGLLAVIAALLAPQASAQIQGRFSGQVMGDYYYVAHHHDRSLQDRNGFWIRRIHLTYDRILAPAWSTRLRLEMSQPGDFSSGIASPFLKDAYVCWERGTGQLFLGISPSPTWQIVQSLWGYRMLEKTPLDLQKMGDGRDFGIAAKGSLDARGKLTYHAMIGNGTGHRSPRSKGKKAMLSLAYWPNRSTVFEVYADHAFRTTDASLRYTVQAFWGYQSPGCRCGLLWASQEHIYDTHTVRLELASAFVVLKLNEKWHGLVRVDRTFDPNPNGDQVPYLPLDPHEELTILIVAMDFVPAAGVHILPNAEAVFYTRYALTDARGLDLVPRCTFYFEL